MCCDNSGCGFKLATEECPECGGPVDKDGYTADHCNYSPVICQTCEAAPCDGSC